MAVSSSNVPPAHLSKVTSSADCLRLDDEVLVVVSHPVTSSDNAKIPSKRPPLRDSTGLETAGGFQTPSPDTFLRRALHEPWSPNVSELMIFLRFQISKLPLRM